MRQHFRSFRFLALRECTRAFSPWSYDRNHFSKSSLVSSEMSSRKMPGSGFTLLQRSVWTSREVPRGSMVVDFTLSASAALQLQQKELKGHVFAPLRTEERTASIAKVWEPFWVFDAQFVIRCLGEVGYQSVTNQWDPRKKRFEQVTTTDWHEVSEPFTFNCTFTRNDKEVQIYASYRSIAWSLCRDHLSAQTLPTKAAQALKEAYNADSVRNLSCSIVHESSSPLPFFLPAYLIEDTHEGWRFQSIVNGATGLVVGERHYSQTKVGLAALAGAFLGLPFLHSFLGSVVLGVPFSVPPLGLPALWSWEGVVYGMVVGGAYLGAKWGPRMQIIAREIRRANRVAEERVRFPEAFEGYGREWVEGGVWKEAVGRVGSMGGLEMIFMETMREWHASGRQQEQQRQREWEEEQKKEEFRNRHSQQNEGWQEGGRGRGRGRRSISPDPKGYYRELEVTMNATEEEIKSAYRKLALETHPDHQRQKDPRERARAEDRFKRIGEAYEVLGKTEERARYDAGF